MERLLENGWSSGNGKVVPPLSLPFPACLPQKAINFICRNDAVIDSAQPSRHNTPPNLHETSQVRISVIHWKLQPFEFCAKGGTTGVHVMFDRSSGSFHDQLYCGFLG